MPKASKPVQNLVTEYLRVHGRDWRADEEKKDEKKQEKPIGTKDGWEVGEEVLVQKANSESQEYTPAVITGIVDPDSYGAPFKVRHGNIEEWVSADRLRSPQFNASSLNRPFSKKALLKQANPDSRYWIAPDGKEFEVAGVHGSWIAQNAKLLKQYGIIVRGKEDIHKASLEMKEKGWIRVSNEPAGTGFQIELVDMHRIPTFLDDFVAKHFKKGDEISIGDPSNVVYVANPFPSLQRAINKELRQNRSASLYKKAAVSGQAVNEILQSIESSGGATFNFSRGNLAGTGNYSVSIYPERSKIVPGVVDFEEIENYIVDNEDLLRDSHNSFGAWTNEGKVYLDVVATLPDREKAIQLGRQHNQIAIWDLKNSQEIPTGGTGIGPKAFSKSDFKKKAERMEVGVNGDGAVLTVIVNPSSNEALGALHKSSHGLRYLVDDQENIFIWDSYSATHQEIGNKLIEDGYRVSNTDRAGFLEYDGQVRSLVGSLKTAEESLLSQIDQNEIAAASSPAYNIALNNYAQAVKRGHSKDRALAYAVDSVANIEKIDEKKLVQFINTYLS
jgi:hypothetical protein